ncbi:DUF3089 domain-containing protein [Ihubacter massiliensis]|uniref:DUF3089 domain-containing protein n=1 Tax=Hominibacterium faecale TaxID=2839743 RepID=A0A9J6QU17_9FIRM|nr:MULTISPECIES: DUF3089 domain-containing protein [Eubacteriales Family XIII. Incertae Sedis]MCO7123380.1 DUF3089 domain-containing protein [Ihubacter massiliensis]MCU7379677.1 DUF3089 domain-containing protein [Hominibacterium faecale]
MKTFKRCYCALCILLIAAVFSACEGPTDSVSVPVAGDDITASDYSQNDNWMMLPKESDKPVDVFYLYPTAWGMEDEEDNPICTIDYEPMRKRAQAIAAGQATAFETVGNIYAPYYRQIDAAYLLSKPISEQPQYTDGVPGTDALAAFDYYMKHYNKGRPFILAGHSQGSVMTKLILFQYLKEHPQAARRMVAAYVIGYSVTEEELKENPHVKFAESANDTGVIVSYNTEAPKVDGKNNTVLDGSVAINPISWTRSGRTAPKEDNLGAYMPQEDGSYKKVAALVDAAVDLDRGTVICTTVDPKEYANPNKAFFPLGVYHSKDYAFYYYNLRENAENRTAKFLAGAN